MGNPTYTDAQGNLHWIDPSQIPVGEAFAIRQRNAEDYAKRQQSALEERLRRADMQAAKDAWKERGWER